MDTLEAIQLPKTFWNSNDPTVLDPFDDTLVAVPTMASPLEACSSTFLFPSTSTTCCDVDSDDSTQIFKRPPSQQTIFDEIVTLEGGAESRGVVTNSNISSMETNYHSSQFSWLSAAAPPHGYGQQQQLQQEMTEKQKVSASLQQPVHYGGTGQLVPEFFGPLNNSSSQIGSTANSTALDYNSGHGSAPPTNTFRRPENLGQQQLNVVKASWQSANMFSEQRRSVQVEPLGSPCSVISGFTKVVDQFVIANCDYNMEQISGSTNFGPSTSSALAAHLDDPAAGKLYAQSSTRIASTAPQLGGAQYSMSGTQSETANIGVVMKRLTTKRKRSKAPKLCNEVESQRMTHIAVERNRRKQMNEHLAALRALMPGSYVQKGDQASIVGGAIEFVKELEHLLHCLQAQKRRRAYSDLSNAGTPTSRLAMQPNIPELQFCHIQPPPFSFHSPQRQVDQSPFLVGAASGTDQNSLSPVNARQGVTMSNPITPQQQQLPTNILSVPAASISSSSSTLLQAQQQGVNIQSCCNNVGSGESSPIGEVVGEAGSEMATVEVRAVGADAAVVKIMALRRAGQLLRTVVALESLALTVLHTNITTVGPTVLYSFHVHLNNNHSSSNSALGQLPCSSQMINVHHIARQLHQTFASLHALQF